MPPLFIDTSLNATLLPELSLAAVQDGTAKEGATIQALPPVHEADNLPGVNCSHCEAPKDWLEPNLVKPMAVPRSSRREESLGRGAGWGHGITRPPASIRGWRGARGLPVVPVQDLRAGPHHDAIMAQDVVV